MSDRRSFLRGLAALPIAAMPAVAAASAPPDPLVETNRRAAALLASLSEGTLSEDEGDAVFAEMGALQHEAFLLRPTTLAGAIASLEWARREFDYQYVGGEPNPDWLDRMTLNLLDGSLGVLREAMARGVAL